MREGKESRRKVRSEKTHGLKSSLNIIRVMYVWAEEKSEQGFGEEI